MAVSCNKRVDEFLERRHWQVQHQPPIVTTLVLNEVSSSIFSHADLLPHSFFRSSANLQLTASDLSVCGRFVSRHLAAAQKFVLNCAEFDPFTFSVMRKDGIFDLEKQFAFYGSFHNHPVNVAIHLCFVWPIFFTLLILIAYTDPLVPQWAAMATLPFHEYMVFNYSFVLAAVFALFFVALEPKSGSLAASLVLLCWMGSNAVAQHFPYTTGWKIVAIAQTVCWGTQFIGHGVFEGRAPALFDNFVFANLVAPYFILLELLHKLFLYEPYAGFSKNVQKRVDASIAEFRANKTKAKAKGKRV